MPKVIFLSAVFAAAFMADAHAERPRTGEDLLRLCESPANQYDRDYCYGYARGVEMGVRQRDKQEQTCTMSVPTDVTEPELLESVIASLKAQPALLQQPAFDVALAAFIDEWPCS